MTELNWDRFENLPGDRRTNFELLWRGAVWLTFARYGKFASRAQQPGVEFHLDLERDCQLGAAGQWFGWQTKWWDIGSGTQIGKTRRLDVEDSQAKTKRHVPGLTDWVLCTRRPLTPEDQKWYDGLAPGFKLHNQVSEELATLLAGDAALLRETYFGDLVLTPDRLTDARGTAVEEVRDRWFPEVHQSTAAEQTLRRMLAEPEAWTDLAEISDDINDLIRAIQTHVAATPLPAGVQTELDALLGTAQTVRGLLADAHEHVAKQHDHTWLELGEVVVPESPALNPPVLRRLRAANHPASLACTNLVAGTRRAAVLAGQVFSQLQVRLAVVTGDAGFGKTQLAAKLTDASGDRPAGVLLYGRRLGARDDLDKLARQITCAGKPVETFEALLAAVDAAAARAGCRLPIVIDGLNEAENPTEWKPLLGRLQATLARYPSVLVVCTVRRSFVDRVLPSTVTDQVELDGFTHDLDDAVERYFDFFKIDTDGADLPRELFRQPLALRIFCSVANPDREGRVSLALLPRSLQAMFGEYLKDVGQRVDRLHAGISSADVERALQQLGLEMWDTGARAVSEDRARELFNDTGRWAESILAALEHEGILLRQPTEDAESASAGAGMTVAVVYDLLAGHIIASALLRTRGSAFTSSLCRPDTMSLFRGSVDTRHPLSADVFDALVFLAPEEGAGHLWALVDGPLVESALMRVTALAPEEVDAGTVEAFTQHFETLVQRRDFWPGLEVVRAVPSHPLNSTYLDAVLRPLAVADRDLLWTEWLRTSADTVLAEIGSLTDHWRNRADRTDADALRARWVMWMLTSTVRDLRDAATAALYWYGRGDADGLFALAIESLTVNDAYVGERVVAAAYGIATANQLNDPEFGDCLATYLNQLAEVLTGPTATTPTFHRLTRYYAAGTIEFARVHYPGAIPAAVLDSVEFAPGPLPEALHDDDARRNEVRRTIHMDFGNYTLGRLFDDRRNYDYDHAGHRDATDRILGVVYDLGWRQERFEEIESRISRRDNDRGPGRIERYGKKYGWIGFYLVSGMLNAQGDGIPWLEVDVDPTFPQPSPRLPMELPAWARPTPRDERRWLVDGKVAVPDELLYCASLDGVEGPWVLVHAEIRTEGRSHGRNVFGLFNTVAVDAGDLDPLMDYWSGIAHPGRDLIDLASAYYLFAGEIPWHSRMVTSGDDDPYYDDLRIEEIEDLDGARSGLGDTGGGDILPAEDSNLDWEELAAGLIRRQRDWPTYRTLRFESLAHGFSWEGHHSSQNQEFAYVPSQRLSHHFGLRAGGASFDQFEAGGKPASRSFGPPEGFAGYLLYVREDLVKAFARGRAVVTLGWGERETRFSPSGKVPERLLKVYQAGGNVWRTHRMVVEPESPSEEASHE